MRERKESNCTLLRRASLRAYLLAPVLFLILISFESRSQTFTPLEDLGLVATSQNNNWRYTMGYRFRVETDGAISGLGGRWASGVTHTVRLYAYPSGTVLRSVNVTNSGSNYTYATLGSSLSVSKGDLFVVAVELNRQNSGEECQGNFFPVHSKGIQILGTCTLRNSNNMPTNLLTNTMFGTADIQFQPCSFAGDINTTDDYVGQGGSSTITVSNSIGGLSWQSSTDGLNFNMISGQNGTQLNTGALNQDTYYRVIAQNTGCSDTSDIIKVGIFDPNYPLQALEAPLIAQEQNWDYNAGYRFAPTVDGQVTALGGLWKSGVNNTVRLYDAGGTVLASSNVNGSSNWAYNSISPVSLTANSTYFVAVRQASNGSGVLSDLNMPVKSGAIRILSSGFIVGSNAIPTNSVTNQMYGQPDIRFEPCVSAGVINASFDEVQQYDSTLLFVTGNSSAVTWQSSADGINFTTLSSGSDTISSGKLSADRYFRTVNSDACGNDTSSIKLISVIDPSRVLQSAKPSYIADYGSGNKNLGYRFTANVNGNVTELGGKWESAETHTVRLYAYPAGTVLASANIPGNNGEWVYNSITPVALTAGSQYVVSTRFSNSSRGSYGLLNSGYPYEISNIVINNSTIGNNNNMPTSTETTLMYGFSDIKFEPCVYAGDLRISDTLVCPGSSISVEVQNSIGNIQWQSSTDGINFTSIAGGVDTVLTVNSINTSTYYRAVLSAVCGNDTSEALELRVIGSGGIAGVWTALDGNNWNNACNWDNGVVPVTGDGVVIPVGTPSPQNVPELDLSSLRISNGGVFSLDSNLRISDSLILENGFIKLGASDIILESGASVSFQNSTTYLKLNGSGLIRQELSATDLTRTINLPIGDSLYFSPVELTFTAAVFSIGAYLDVSCTPQAQGNALTPSNYLRRYWTLQASGVNTPVYNISVQYNDQDVSGSEALLRLQLYDGQGWTAYGTANTSTNSISGTAITNFGDFTGFDNQAIQNVITGNWSNPSTWTNGIVPDTLDNAIIIPGTSVSLTGPETIGGVSVSTSASLDCQNNLLELKGNLDFTGQITGLDTLIFSGSNAQDIDGLGSINLNTMIINNPVSVEINSGNIEVTDQLNIERGDLVTNSAITLVSDSTRTANLGPVLGSLTGQLTVQRHINGLDNTVGWRHFSSPLQGTTLQDLKYNASTYPGGIYFYGFTGSNQSYVWQNAYSFSEASAGAANNFDNGWIAATNISNAISYNLPYTIYTGGVNFRSYDLEISGFPNVGNINLSGLSFTNALGWHMIGNPYPSSIDWSAVTKTGIDAVAYLFSETNGGYVPTNLLPNPNQIAPFQAFFVRVNNTTNSIAFEELDKVDNDAVFQKRLEHLDRLRLRLTNTRIGRFSPAAIDWRDDATELFDHEYDAYRLYSGYPFPNLGIIPSTDTIEYQVVTDALGKAGYEYELRALTPLSDTMEFWVEEFPDDIDLCMLCTDLVLDTSFLLKQGTKYKFYLPDSSSDPRFRLRIFDASASISVKNVSCFGDENGSLKMNIPDWSSFNVDWYNVDGSLLSSSKYIAHADSITGLKPGEYRVVYTDSAGVCGTYDKSFKVEEPLKVEAEFESSTDTAYEMQVIQFRNHSGGASNFYWTFGDGDFSTEVNPDHSFGLAGDYQVSLIAFEAACHDTISKEVHIKKNLLGRDDRTEHLHLNLSKSNIHIEGLTHGSHELSIFNMNGQMLHSDQFQGPEYFKDGLKIKPGTYLIQLDGISEKRLLR